ncbi:hypothetical protein H0H93_010070 [Arthromyces matolae]|nr:hypothetical protein H0H93_010070 [Arthromyces matolae]
MSSVFRRDVQPLSNPALPGADQTQGPDLQGLHSPVFVRRDDDGTRDDNLGTFNRKLRFEHLAGSLAPRMFNAWWKSRHEKEQKERAASTPQGPLQPSQIVDVDGTGVPVEVEETECIEGMEATHTKENKAGDGAPNSARMPVNGRPGTPLVFSCPCPGKTAHDVAVANWMNSLDSSRKTPRQG